jgi:type VI secretion system secreted protein Hcp
MKIAEAPGGSKTTKHEGEIELLGCEYQLVSPRDVATGQASGKRVHYPVEVAGKVDKASPLLFKAVAENQVLKKVEINCWTAANATSSAKEGDVLMYTLELKDARASRFKHFTYEDGTFCFIAAFTFQAITLTWKEGGISHEDDWLGT